MARNHGPAQPQPSPSQPQPMPAPPKSLFTVSIASRKGSYFWSKMGVPDHAERAEMADSGTPSGPMQQRYDLKKPSADASKMADSDILSGSMQQKYEQKKPSSDALKIVHSDTSSGSMQQRYGVKTRPSNRAKWLFVVSRLDQCTRDASSFSS